jgi:hypothetical protein
LVGKCDEGRVVAGRRAEEEGVQGLSVAVEVGGERGEQGFGRVRLGDGDAYEGGEAGAGGGAQGVGRAVAGVGLAVEAGAAFDGFGGADRHGEFFGHQGAESACPPQGGYACCDEQLQGAPEPARGEQVEEALAAGVGGRGVGQRGEVPDQMGARAEELEGERGVALLVETLVDEDAGRADDDGVAAPGRVREPEQGRSAVAGVALVGVGGGGRVPVVAGFRVARALGGGQGAVGGERRVEG